MKFSRLRLHGFKSFSDWAELVMEPGLTGVVGPNGCGKSNLVEALRWAMGESSYKAMRAAGMDDVIFSGSANRPARNSAEVTLVLDNSDRTAPAALNTADVLEVTRRIERESGSVYRVNGREVRARDVQLLFADASTGAHSPALVRQGQIGELIAAKPTQRRALLEEAAGISGLHSRRHEAELRLKGAESNLDRVDDIIAQVDGQLETLKRQARLAIRYRTLSADIRRAEATLFHIRWVAARFAEREAEAENAQLSAALTGATAAELEAQKAALIAEQALGPARERNSACTADAQHLTQAAEQLEREERRIRARQGELNNRLQQLAADQRREQVLCAECDEQLASLDAQKSAVAAQASDPEILAGAQGEAEAARAGMRSAESEAQAIAARLAAAEAQQHELKRRRSEAEGRLRRLTDEAARITTDLAALDRRVDEDCAEREALAALEAAGDRAKTAESVLLDAEAATRNAHTALEAARPPLQAAEAALARLEAEAETLRRFVSGSTGQ